MVETLVVVPVDAPLRGTLRPPGSKSITNRALNIAALADGQSQLAGVLDSDDTRVMIASLRRLGIAVSQNIETCTATVVGCAGRPPATDAELWLENSGTSIRFLTALSCLGSGRYRLDGNARMRERPIQDLCDALRPLGGIASCENANRCPPVVVQANGLRGGSTRVSAQLSSQYLSALLMSAPSAAAAVEVTLEGALVSEPYVAMTLKMMRSFGVDVEADAGQFRVDPQNYRATRYEIEPDASAAGYFFAAAAITGGEVTVPGLCRDSLQGDVRFVDVLEQMGCQVDWSDDSITVCGGSLRGVDVDMNDISDTAQTLAAAAVFADGPTRIRNIAHVRHKETDRIHAVATELRRLGIHVEEFDDGLAIVPGPVRPATVETYDDHRMAMSFALIGLRARGIGISNPGCTAKTYPRFFDDLASLRGDRQ